MKIDSIISNAVQKQASDIHLSINSIPLLRIHGEMMPVKTDKISKEDMNSLVETILNEEQKQKFAESKELDFSFASKENNIRVRANLYEDVNGTSIVMRLISNDIKTLDDIHAPQVLKRISELEKGLVLVTGPTGSGKSTTMAAMINYINQKFSKHIIILEDPIEFVHKSQNSKVTQREIGTHTHSFASALRSAMREDPDVIMVGEMRDLETIQLAITAAETGHLVIGTLHANSTIHTVDRIIDVFPAEEKEMIRTLLSNSLEAAIAQQLIKNKDHTGRAAAYEVLIANSAVRNLIRENKTAQLASTIQTGAASGMQTMKDAINKLAKQGMISSDLASSKPDTKSSDSKGTQADPKNLSSGF